MSKPTYRVVAVGGTFDILHKGHEQLLTKCFEVGEKVLIGVTSDKLVRTLRKSHPVHSYRFRLREVKRFLQKRGWTSRAKISPLTDPYGPAASRKDLQALIVTPSTLDSGRKLNQIRKQKGLKPVAVMKVRLAKAWDGKPISASRIRKGEVDRYGRRLRDEAL